MCVFQDVTVGKHRVICKNHEKQFCWPMGEWALTYPEYISQAVFADSLQGSRFFGHWLRDDCALNLTLPTGLPAIRPSRDPWADELFYSELLQMRPVQSIDHARIDRLIYVDDLSNNSDKTARIHTNRYQMMKTYQPGHANDIVYVARGKSARGTVNKQ